MFSDGRISLNSASAAASECEWVQVVSDVYVPHRKYQVKPHSSPWFNNKSEYKVKFRQASNCCERVLEVAKLAYANKTKEPITSWDFW